MTSIDNTGINPERKIAEKIRRRIARPILQAPGTDQTAQQKDPEKSPEQFWSFKSVEASINVSSLYEYLSEKGFRYFQTSDDKHKYIVSVIDGMVKVHLEFKLWRLCYSLVETGNDFKSLTEGERTCLKNAFYNGRKTVKKSKLTKLKTKVLEKCQDSPSKAFLQRSSTKSSLEEGGTLC